MLSKSLKLSAVALSTTFVMACVPDPWQGTLQFGQSEQSGLRGIHQLKSGDVISLTNNGVLYRFTNAGDTLWSTQLPVDSDYTKRMVVDSNEDAYILVENQDGDYFDTTYTALILKVDHEGNTIWTRYLSCPEGNVHAGDIEIGSNGTMYAQLSVYCENFLATEPQGDLDNVILKMDSNTGDVLWTRRDGEPGVFIDSIFGSLLYTNSDELVSFHTLASDTAVSRVQKFSADGELLLESEIANDFFTEGKAAVDAENNIYVTGSTGELSFYDQPPLGMGDVGLLKLDSELNVVWARLLGTNHNDSSNTGVFLDGSGYLYLGGWTMGALPGNQNQGQGDAFISKWSVDGLNQWSVQIGTDASDSALALGIGREGGAFLAGRTLGELVPGADVSERLFISKLTPEGTIISKQPAQ